MGKGSKEGNGKWECGGGKEKKERIREVGMRKGKGSTSYKDLGSGNAERGKSSWKGRSCMSEIHFLFHASVEPAQR